MTIAPYSWRIASYEKIHAGHKLTAEQFWCGRDGEWRFWITPVSDISYGGEANLPGLRLHDYGHRATPEEAMRAADEALNEYLQEQHAHQVMLAEGAPEVAGQAVACG